MKIMIINGPSLNMLGQREPAIYGSRSFDDYLVHLRQRFADISISYHQSNSEGQLIDFLQEAHHAAYDGIVLNAGAYSHTSIALRDAIAAISPAVVEVHISNIYAREQFRHQSMLTAVCRGMICGLGLDGYAYAIAALTAKSH